MRRAARLAAAACSPVLEQALALRAEAAGRPARRPGLDLRPRPRRGRRSREHHPPIPPEEFDKTELLRLEKETLGLYVSEHPLSSIRGELRAKTDATLAELERRRDGEIVTVGGIVSEVKHLTTKKGEPMVFMRLDDVTGGTEMRRLQLDLRRLARAVRPRPDPDRQGPGRPQGGRDEADRAGGDGVRGGRRASARCALRIDATQAPGAA